MANFESFIPEIELAEGGFQKNETDGGNYNSLNQLVGTNRGIAASTYERYIGRPPTEQDMRNITRDVALTIFKNNYWNVIKADQINSQAIAETFVDMKINAVGRNAERIMQESLNELGHNLVVDKSIGDLTLNAMNNTHPKELFLKYNQKRRDFYNNIQNHNYPLWEWANDSWQSRVTRLYEKHINALNKIKEFTQKNKKSILGTLFIMALSLGLIIKNK